MRPTGWLLVDEVLMIPILPRSDWPRTTVETYAVQPGESWSKIAAQFQISRTLLRAVNPELRRPGYVLFTGDIMVIPPAPAVSESQAGKG